MHAVEGLVARTSYHSPLMLHMAKGSKGPRRRVRFFKYEAKWATMEGCER